jgi:hypothetical protein
MRQMAKKIQRADFNMDGVTSHEELLTLKELEELEMLDRKQSAQKKMAWVSICAMVGVTVLLFSPIISIERIDALSDLLGLFYISQAGVVGAFMGVAAWMSRK